MEDGLIQHRAPAEVSAVSEVAVDMAGPQRESDIVEGNYVYLIQVLARDDVPYVAVPPVSRSAILFDGGAS